MDLVLDLVLGLMLVSRPGALLMDLVLGLMTSSSSSSTWCSPDGRGAGRRGAHRIDARSWLWREALVSLGQRSQTGSGQDGKLKEELTILQS